MIPYPWIYFLISWTIGPSLFQDTDHFILADGTSVTVIIVMEKESGKRRAYYLPANLRISTNKSNKKEISLIKYKKDNEQSAIFHMLLTWGLTKYQLTDLQQCIKERYKEVVQLYGSYNLTSSSGLNIYSKGAIGSILKRAAKHIYIVPLNPGLNMALSAKLSDAETTVVERYLKHQSGDAASKIEIVFTYSLPRRIGRNTGINQQHKLESKIKDLF